MYLFSLLIFQAITIELWKFTNNDQYLLLCASGSFCFLTYSTFKNFKKDNKNKKL